MNHCPWLITPPEGARAKIEKKCAKSLERRGDPSDKRLFPACLPLETAVKISASGHDVRDAHWVALSIGGKEIHEQSGVTLSSDGRLTNNLAFRSCLPPVGDSCRRRSARGKRSLTLSIDQGWSLAAETHPRHIESKCRQPQWSILNVRLSPPRLAQCRPRKTSHIHHCSEGVFPFKITVKLQGPVPRRRCA